MKIEGPIRYYQVPEDDLTYTELEKIRCYICMRIGTLLKLANPSTALGAFYCRSCKAYSLRREYEKTIHQFISKRA